VFQFTLRVNVKFSIVLLILEWEKKLNIVLNIPSRLSKDIIDEEKKVLAMLTQIMELESIYSHILTVSLSIIT
jgi:hypothetical protein